ncbi:PP2C family protein-serine/threonine phosphatase [Streptomyces sp. NPDC093085]|uniref:PP2C family protein-serine/threonine phosphatase n=1 Tax=Streptomyces sp. NPDC093085 TaxID=3155068 RepID=UPI00344739D4
MNRTRADRQTNGEEITSWGFMECAVPGGLLALVITWELTRPPSERYTLLPRVVTCVAFVLLMAYLVMRVRRRAAREILQVRAVARAAQEVLLRPLPARLDGLALHARQLSASRGAEVGGDLYEVMATTHGVRVVIGDVRGHGLPAIGTVAAVLGSFREAAHDESGLDGVLRRLDRAHQRHLRERARRDPDPECAAALRVAMLADGAPAPPGGAPGGPPPGGPPGPGGRAAVSAAGIAEVCRAARPEPVADDGDLAEEFVTVLLLEIGPDAEVHALNCGHPGPYRLGSGAEPLPCGDPLPPLGAVPLPAELTPYRCGRLRPGEALFLHTDGAEDARDRHGRFFGLEAALTAAATGGALSPAALVAQVHAALLAHTDGRITDDMALLVVRNDRVDGVECPAAARRAVPAGQAGDSGSGGPAGRPPPGRCTLPDAVRGAVPGAVRDGPADGRDADEEACARVPVQPGRPAPRRPAAPSRP